jgi:hypothetical protein
LEPAALPPSGLPENYQVGGVASDGRSQRPSTDGTAGPTRPYETGDRFAFQAAAPDSLNGSVLFTGTSGSAPSTAGRAADLIQYARTLLHSHAGFSSGALATADRDSRLRLPARGPLRDGRLTRDELIDVLHHVAVPAEPAGPTRYAIEGYGALTREAMATAKRVLAGSQELPSRTEEDQQHALVEGGRGALFPAGRCG